MGVHTDLVWKVLTQHQTLSGTTRSINRSESKNKQGVSDAPAKVRRSLADRGRDEERHRQLFCTDCGQMFPHTWQTISAHTCKLANCTDSWPLCKTYFYRIADICNYICIYVTRKHSLRENLCISAYLVISGGGELVCVRTLTIRVTATLYVSKP